MSHFFAYLSRMKFIRRWGLFHPGASIELVEMVPLWMLDECGVFASGGTIPHSVQGSRVDSEAVHQIFCTEGLTVLHSLARDGQGDTLVG